MSKNNQLINADLLWCFCSLEWYLGSKIGGVNGPASSSLFCSGTAFVSSGALVKAVFDCSEGVNRAYRPFGVVKCQHRIVSFGDLNVSVSH